MDPSEPSGPEIAPNAVIAGKYRLIRTMAEGGMGSVWLALNVALDARVAVKLIRRDSAAAGAAERLQREARAAARLRHPSIVRVFDVGATESGEPFIVMELLEGETLAARIDRAGRMPAVEAVRTLLPIVDALGYAHQKGIVHRDVKSENVFLAHGERGTVEPKIVDFGIAKLEEPRSRRITVAGSLLGSPDTMSPEQARGESDLDGRTDIWSLCAVAYEALSGRLPFDAPGYHAVLRQILEAEPVFLAELGVCDAALARIVHRGLEKERERRFTTARELGEALAAWLAAQGVDVDIRNASLRASWIDAEPESSLLPPILVPPDPVRASADTLARFSEPPATLRPRVLSGAPPGAPRLGVRRALIAAGTLLVAVTATLVSMRRTPAGAPPSIAADAAATRAAPGVGPSAGVRPTAPQSPAGSTSTRAAGESTPAATAVPTPADPTAKSRAAPRPARTRAVNAPRRAPPAPPQPATAATPPRPTDTFGF